MPFELQPLLKGKLLKLRPIRRDDFDELFKTASDPLIWEQHPNKDRYKKEVFIEFFREAIESGGALICIENRSGKIIGSSRYYGFDEIKSEIELGWTFLARKYWGGIYNKEMKELMLNHAFRFVDNVVFKIGLNNFRSQKAVEKLGAVLIGKRLDDGENESLVYLLTKREYSV
jgi:N-acetyltransferase